MTNIDLNNVAWAGIKWFNGTFDGNNYTLYNVKLTYQVANTGSSYQYSYGIFTTGTGDILNLNVVHSAPPVIHTQTQGTGGYTVYYWIGGLSAKTSGKIQNCKVTNFVLDDLPETKGYCGGILGSGGADIIDCVVEGFYYNDSEGSNIGSVGGAAGECFGDITNLKVVDTIIISATDGCVGGAVGDSCWSATSIAQTWTSISVDAEIVSTYTKEKWIGGIVGRVNAVHLTKSIFKGKITSTASGGIGGIVGYACFSGQVAEDEWYITMGHYQELLFDGEILMTGATGYATYVGGIVGEYEGASWLEEEDGEWYDPTYINELDNCLSIGKITIEIGGYINVGGIIGNFMGEHASRVNYCVNVAQIIATQKFSSSDVESAFGTIMGTMPYDYVTYDTCWGLDCSDKISGNRFNSPSVYTSEQLKDPNTYGGKLSSTYWTIDENINDGYPMLRAFITYAQVNGFDGEGTETNPYIIDSAQSFLSFANYYNNDHEYGVDDDVYWQISDSVNELDLSTLSSWRPIGYDSSHAFTGHLLGNKTNISNLVVDENYTYAGLFGNVTSNASIEWLAVYGDVDYDIATYVGGLAGYVADGASISNCYYMGNITGYLNTTTNRNIGGLIGSGAENNVTSSYAIATHTAYGTTTTTTENIQSIYGINTGSTVGDMKTQSTYTQFGFTFSDTAWKLDIQNEGYPYFNLTSCNISAFNITRDITGSGAIMVYVDGQSIPFTDNTSTNSYSAGVTITVEATASTNNAIRSLIINGTTYTSATNKNTITVNNISTTNQAGDFTIVVVFDNQYTITTTNGTHSDQGSTSVTGSNITTTNPYKALKSTNITTTSTATTNTTTLKSYITGVTIDGTLVNISSADNTTTTHTINGITYTITRTKTTGFSTQIVTKITITHTLTKSITISTHYNAQQSVSTSVTLVGGDGTTTSTPTGTITADWGSTTNTLTKTEQTDKTFIGWVVNGQIESQEDTFSTQVTSSTTTITELWAVMYNISLTLPTGTESIQVTHMLTGLSYNITGATTLMAGDWIVKVPTGKTLKLNGTTVVPDSQGRNIVSITGNGTISLV